MESEEEGEVQPVLFDLEPALVDVNLTSVFRPCSFSRGCLPHRCVCSAERPEWSQMVDPSQPAFDNQMLSSHRGVLGLAAGGELSFAEHQSALPAWTPRTAPAIALAARRGPRSWHDWGRGIRQRWV